MNILSQTKQRDCACDCWHEENSSFSSVGAKIPFNLAKLQFLTVSSCGGPACTHKQCKCWNVSVWMDKLNLSVCFTSVLDPSLQSGVSVHHQLQQLCTHRCLLRAFSDGARCQSKRKVNHSLIGAQTVCSETVKRIAHMADARPASLESSWPTR